MGKLTPYDTGVVAEPRVWPVVDDYLDSYGKVDFDDDESATVATVQVARNERGGYTIEVFGDAERLTIKDSRD